MIRILIVEDEVAALRRIQNLLSECPYANEVVKTAESLEDTVRFLQDKTAIDLILMDIHLSDGNSLDIFDMTEVPCPVIFITAFDEYAVKAFKKLAVDYLLKPLKREELFAAIGKYADYFANRHRDTAENAGADAGQRYLIKIGNNLKTIDKGDVAYYFTASKITYLVTFEGKKYPLEQSLEQVEETAGNAFFRLNRQYIIHRDSIEGIQKFTKSRLRIKVKGLAETMVVSTEKAPVFRNWLVG